MVPINKLRINSILSITGEYAKVTSLTVRSMSLAQKSSPEIELQRSVGALDVKGVVLTEDLIKEKLHFVKYETPPPPQELLDRFNEAKAAQEAEDLEEEQEDENEYEQGIESPRPRGFEVKEYTDGRIIVRVNEESIAVFQPNNFPWAAPMGWHMDYVCSITQLHELQNIYLDLFNFELDVDSVI